VPRALLVREDSLVGEDSLMSHRSEISRLRNDPPSLGPNRFGVHADLLGPRLESSHPVRGSCRGGRVRCRVSERPGLRHVPPAPGREIEREA